MAHIPGHTHSGTGIMSALLGGAVWVSLLASTFFGNDMLDRIELLLLLAPLVFIPLAIDLVADIDERGMTPLLYRLARSTQPFGALLATLSFLLPIGIWSGILAAGWLLVTLVAAGYALRQMLHKGLLPIDALCINMGLLYLPIGGTWLVISRLGVAPLGFGGIIALLTAVHFHFAGCIAPILAGMTGRALSQLRPAAWNVYRIAAAGIIAGPPLVALGITVSSSIEIVAAVVLASSLTILAILVLFVIGPRLGATRPRLLLGISAIASFVAMIFACLYALGSFLQRSFITVPEMVIVHGCLNAVFALGGLLGWGIVRPAHEPGR